MMSTPSSPPYVLVFSRLSYNLISPICFSGPASGTMSFVLYCAGSNSVRSALFHIPAMTPTSPRELRCSSSVRSQQAVQILDCGDTGRLGNTERPSQSVGPCSHVVSSLQAPSLTHLPDRKTNAETHVRAITSTDAATVLGSSEARTITHRLFGNEKKNTMTMATCASACCGLSLLTSMLVRRIHTRTHYSTLLNGHLAVYTMRMREHQSGTSFGSNLVSKPRMRTLSSPNL